MYENLIRMIPWENFWEPNTNKQRYIKWGIIALVLLLGISIFLMNLDEMQDYEYACNNPVLVEAQRKVVYVDSIYHDVYLSYTHNDIQYDDIFYMTVKNPSITWDGVDTLTVAVAPKDPGIPIRNMFNTTPISFGVVLWALGFSMFVYGIAIEFPSFRDWRVKQANRPGFLSRPYGKPAKYTSNPDYLKDFVFLFISIILIFLFILDIFFPYTF